MKFLKYLLIIIAVLAIVFFGYGLLNPSQTYSSEITVNKPLKEAWAIMQDESKTQEWLKFITKMEHISGEKGKVGAVTEYTFLENGQESKIRETITSITPNEQITMDFVAEGVMTMDYTLNIKEDGGETRISSSTITKGEGLFMQSMFAFMGGSLQAQEDENMNNLKTVIESNTTDYFPVAPIEDIVEEEVE